MRKALFVILALRVTLSAQTTPKQSRPNAQFSLFICGYERNVEHQRLECKILGCCSIPWAADKGHFVPRFTTC